MDFSQKNISFAITALMSWFSKCAASAAILSFVNIEIFLSPPNIYLHCTGNALDIISLSFKFFLERQAIEDVQYVYFFVTISIYSFSGSIMLLQVIFESPQSVPSLQEFIDLCTLPAWYISCVDVSPPPGALS